ncbi:hypothetical protein CAPTEDRAFT_216868 [Capitella teleta]|uniref:Ion transport domain-containing protein n=1 Tax=Capitella teleta TaxID=283909 RepID=R7TG28_CAPTE|nr:hypothetical protein CAPTEDRAFT_216868 [Capitella teleta]|eukprot:ELT92738.1 hypothetical protein CAPTEDRAFT_216868 [Capitella teleta]
MTAIRTCHIVDLAIDDIDHEFSEENCLECTRDIKESFMEYQIREIGPETSVVHRVNASLFHAALVRDPDFVLRVLRNLEDDEAEFILNALVDSTSPQFVNDTWTQLAKKEIESTSQMVSVIVSVGGNQKLLRQLAAFKLDLIAKDDDGNSLLHHLVDISEKYPSTALSMYDVIQQVLEIDELKQLIKARNKRQETALDIASRCWLPEMMHAILNTNKVYKFLLGECGTFNHYYYDVTELEATKNEYGITPLFHLSLVPEHRLKRFDEFQLLRKEPFATSIEELFYFGKHITLSWLLSWIAFVILYFTALFHIIVSSDMEVKTTLNIMIILVASLGCISEFMAVPAMWPLFKLIMRNTRAGKQPVSMVFFYKMLQTSFYVAALIAHCLHLVGLRFICSSVALQYIFLLIQLNSIVNGILGVLFFTQLSNKMGHWLIVIEKMLLSMSSFVVLSCFYIVAFTLAFSLVVSTTVACETANNGTVAFNGMINSLYETTVLGLGVTVPKDLYFRSNASSLLVILIFVGSAVFNTLIMVNLMIAIMNHRMTALCDHAESIVLVAQVAIYELVELKTFSLQKLSPCILPATLRKRCIAKSEDGTRSFLYTIEPVEVPE